METVYNQLLTEAKAISSKLISCRRHLHAHPELSFQEHDTQRYLEQQLKEAGIADVKRIAETGLLVKISGNGRAAGLLLRGDMDALPIQEVSGRPYGSKNDGVMHACGHDVHSTCALGACLLLHEHRHKLNGPVYIVFQPGEELLPGGATKVMADPEWQFPPSWPIIGLHVDSDIPVGSYGVRSGQYMASCDEIYLDIVGDGGHGALAHRHIDTIAIAAQVINSLQHVVSRKAPPDIATVLSFGRITSEGGATNVMTRKVSLEGTFRTYDESWRSQAHHWIEQIASQTASSLGATAVLRIVRGYPALANDSETTNTVQATLAELVGQEQVKPLSLRPTAEDFAWYLTERPGTFFRLGVRNEERGITHGVHTNAFDVDEACLPYGAAALAATAIALQVS